MVREGVRMVCFDAGGVLVRICRTWREGCAAAGVEHRESEAAALGEAERQAIHDAYQRGALACEEFFRRLAATTAGLYSSTEVRAVHDAWILGEYAGVRALIGRLNSAPGLQTGLLSNTNASHWTQAHMLGGRGRSAVGLVRHPHASHLLGLAKPGVEIYRAFERETGATAEHILFFDDMPENVEAARSAGWRAELIDHQAETCGQLERHLAVHGVLRQPVRGPPARTYNPPA